MQIDHPFIFKIKKIISSNYRNIKSFINLINKVSISDLSKIFIMKMKYIVSFIYRGIIGFPCVFIITIFG